MDSLYNYFDHVSDSSISEDLEDVNSLYSGQACSLLSSLEETIEKIDDFLLFEKGFMNGDIVCLASDPRGQLGKVVNIEMTMNLETTNGSKIKNVSCRDLQRIRSASVGDFVILGAWLGKVEKIVDCVTVLFDDGTKCQFSADGPEKIIALSPNIVEDSLYPLYPGQSVQIERSSAIGSSHWLCRTRKLNPEQATISDVDAGLVCVNWLCCAIMNGEKGCSPTSMQDPKNLVLLSTFPHANWQLGDWCVLPLEQSLPYPYYSSGLVREQKISETLIQNRDMSSNFRQIAVIEKTKTKVDVLWQDGSQSLGLDSHLLLPVNIVDAHDFWPHTFVLEKGAVDDFQVPEFQRWGIIKSVDPKARTVQVKWCKAFLDFVASEEEQIEETVSAYELVEHPDYTFSFGEAICKMDKCVVDFPDGNCVGNDKDDKFLSYFGFVVGYEEGFVKVRWASGGTSKVAPYEICRVDKLEGTTTSVLVDENAEAADEELTLNNQFSGQKLKDVLGYNYENLKHSYQTSISQVATGIFGSITSSIFGSLYIYLRKGYSKCTSETENSHVQFLENEALEHCKFNPGGQVFVPNDFELCEHNLAAVVPSSSKNQDFFKHFDMVGDCSDHHFVKSFGMAVELAHVGRDWLKKVHKEWSILEKDLPETIYARVYEERVDLLRAAIVGTDGTPYHDGLFIFDIYLPPQYPNEPPILHYISRGLRINPNLYESGKVCLSLLNTWTGSESEVWNPRSSSILQILLSLQALVLNEKPYFNEAGYDSQIGKADGEKNSVNYNENAFLVNCRSMLYLLGEPPKNFEALVDEHFSRRCRNILLACKAYMGEAPLGYPFLIDNAERRIQKGGTSTGFKIMLSKLYPRLVEAFTQKAFDCSNLLVLDQVMLNKVATVT